MRILVVDDDPAILNMLGEVLRKAGHEVAPCSRGEQAIHKALLADFELVLCDLNLPDVHGLDIIRAIKAQSPHVPILVLSALDPAEWEAQTKSAGAVRWLRKPLRLDDLRREVAMAERSLPRLYVLLFDDDEIHRNRVRNELVRRGSTAVHLTSADQLTEEGRPGLVLIDAGHKDLDEVLAWATLHNVSAFVFHDLATIVDEDRVLRLGASLVLTKPVNVESLLVQSQWLGAGRAPT